MLWIATAAMLGAAAAPVEPSPAQTRQARAVVRIVSAAVIRQAMPEGTAAEGAVVRESRPIAADAPQRPVKLVEFY